MGGDLNKSNMGESMQLRLGAVGPEVSALKKKLIRLGYALTDSGINEGAFGAKTDAAVRDFQSKNHLTVDGWVGRLTMLAIDFNIAQLDGEVDDVEEVDGVKPIYWKPGPYHPMFKVPAGYTHLHPIDVLRSVAGEREILGAKDNPLIAHFHEHSGNLGTHNEGADYHDEVPHCASAQNWAQDGAGCEKSNNALASSYEKYAEKFGSRAYKKGELIPEGAIICIDGHVTRANRPFRWTGSGSFEGFGSNQGNTIKTSTYPQSRIRTICDDKPKPGTRLAPIGTKPIPSTGTGNGESTR